MDVKKQELIDMVLRYTTNLIIQFNGKGSLTVEKNYQVLLVLLCLEIQ
jgi:hypothetical protein